MEEKKEIKIKFTTLTIILIIVAVVIVGLCVYNSNKETDTSNNKEEQISNIASVSKNKVEEYINSIYNVLDTTIPTFDNINSADEEWIWECAYCNLFDEGGESADIVSKEQVEKSAKQVFGEDLKKEFPAKGLEFWLEPKDDGYFVASAGLDPDWMRGYEVLDIDYIDNNVVVEIGEYKYNYLRDETIAHIINIENNDTITKIDSKDYLGDSYSEEEYAKFEDAISTFVKDNVDKFSTAKITLQVDEKTNKLYVKSVERDFELEETEGTPISLEDEKIKEIAEKFHFETAVQASIYKTGSFNLNNIPNDLILRMAWDKLGEEDVTLDFGDGANTETATQKVMNKSVENIFGKSIKYKDESFVNIISKTFDGYNLNKGTITYSNGIYTADYLEGGGGSIPYIYQKAQKAIEYYGDRIEIYVKTAFITPKDYDEEKDDWIDYIYSDYDFNTETFKNEILKISESEFHKENQYSYGYPSITITDNKNMDSIENKLDTYVYTFSIDNFTGDYYLCGFNKIEK